MEKIHRGTSYRTNITYCNGNIIVGSNGMHYADYSVTDKNNGVYFLSAKTGTILKHIEKEGFGDEDVNGVAIHNGRVFFGNDNDEIFVTQLPESYYGACPHRATLNLPLL